MSGRSKTTLLSNLPGRRSAGSRRSPLLVAATTTTFSFGVNPSISTKIWFRVCSLSSCEPITPTDLILPIASISSINIIEGEFFLAVLKRSLTLLAPTPTSISINSLPAIEKNGAFASPAKARAISVLPVPLGPTKRTPLGVLAPSAIYFWGWRKKSTTSDNSCFASSTTATSAKVTFGRFLAKSRALDLPKEKRESWAPLAWRIKKKKNPTIKSKGRTLDKRFNQTAPPVVSFTSISTAFGSTPESDSIL